MQIDPYSISHTRFIRDSRQAFGHRFEVEKPSRDYWHFIGAAVAIAVIVWIQLP